MKILMLAPEPFFESRGTPISVLGRLRALSTLGHEVDLVTYHLGENVSIPGMTIHRIPRVPLVRSMSDRLLSSPFWTFSCSRKPSAS